MPLQVTFDPNPGKLQDMVDNAINRALINHSNVLPNTIYNAVAITFKEGQTPPLYLQCWLGLSSVRIVIGYSSIGSYGRCGYRSYFSSKHIRVD